MNIKYESAVGLNVTNPPNAYLPELIMTLWSEPELKFLKPKEKMDFYKKFSLDFDIFEFYAKLENDLRENKSLVLEGLKKMDENINMERFLSLYLMIDTEESDLTAGMKVDLKEIATPSKGQRPKLQPGMGDDNKDKKKKQKQESIFAPQKLKLS